MPGRKKLLAYVCRFGAIAPHAEEIQKPKIRWDAMFLFSPRYFNIGVNLLSSELLVFFPTAFVLESPLKGLRKELRGIHYTRRWLTASSFDEPLRVINHEAIVTGDN